MTTGAHVPPEGLQVELAIGVPMEISRRKVLLGTAAVGAALTFHGIDQEWTNREWPSDSTVLRTVAGHEQWLPAYYETQDLAPEAWVVAGGLGFKSAKVMASELADLALDSKNTHIPVTYFDYANDGLEPVDLAMELAHMSSKAFCLSLYCHSMGGPALLEGLRKLHKMGVDVPLRRIVLNCSPFDADDAYMARGVNTVDKLGIDGSVAFKFGAGLVLEKPDDNRRGFLNKAWQVVKKARQNAISGVSPRLWTSQIRILADTDLMTEWEDFKGMIAKDTEMVYVASHHDETVEDERASAKYEAFCKLLGAKFAKVYMDPQCGHADNPGACYTIKPWIAASNKFRSPLA